MSPSEPSGELLLPDGVIRRTDPPRARDTLRDGDVECASCSDRAPENVARVDGWRAVVPLDGEPRWCCPPCQRQESDTGV